jgi:hypothetical protein
MSSSQYAKNVLQREITADSERTQEENSERPQREDSGRIRRDFRERLQRDARESLRRDFRRTAYRRQENRHGRPSSCLIVKEI